MLMCILLFCLIGYNLTQMMNEKTMIYYKDLRFWLVVASLVLLLGLTVQSYPL